MASNPYVNKVVKNGSAIIDLTSDTVNASDVRSGKYVHLPTGQRVTGTMEIQTRKSVNITSNGTVIVSPDSGYDSIEEIIISTNVSGGNYDVQSSENADGTQNIAITDAVLPVYQAKTVTENGVVIPDDGYTALSQVVVNVEGEQPKTIYTAYSSISDDVGEDGDVFLSNNMLSGSTCELQYKSDGMWQWIPAMVAFETGIFKQYPGEVWILNETIDVSTAFQDDTQSFHSPSPVVVSAWAYYSTMRISDGVLIYRKIVGTGTNPIEVYTSSGWAAEEYKTIKLDFPATGELLTWLQNNGTKQT